MAPDPYRVWMSEIMLQQTTVAAVKSYFLRFTELWPTVTDLAAAEDADVMAEWAGLGYYARARNLLKCARVIRDEFGGRFPDTYDALLTLPGVGPYTAAAIASIAFDRQATVLDGNVERVMARLHDDHTPLPTAKPILKALADQYTPPIRPGDYAQAVMDLGATICTPKNPACGICPLNFACQARHAGTAPDLPKKLPKKAKPTRHGIAFVGQRQDGAFLLETRPDKGLLGGMLGWPGSDWVDTSQPLPTAQPPIPGEWKPLGAHVQHTFTHFHLELHVWVGDVTDVALPANAQFVARANFRPTDLPTVMRKAFDLARSSLA